jgi:chromosomal replication initiator protein
LGPRHGGLAGDDDAGFAVPAARLDTSRVTPLPLPGVAPSALASRGGLGTRPSVTPDRSVYYAGPENSLVVAAVSRLISAAQTGTPVATPLTLIGPPGCGKSLLASGLAAAWAAAQGDDAVLSVTGVDLRRQLERALIAENKQAGAVADLAERLAGLKLLVIEDLDGTAESAVTVELLTATADRLADAGAALVVTASKPLGEIAGLDARMVGRLAAGLNLEVAAPAEAARRELLVGALAAAGRHVEPAAAADLAAWLSADARRVLAVANDLQNRFGGRKPITKAEARSYITQAAAQEASTPLADIAAVVARYYAMPLRTLRSVSRKAPVVLARAVTIYLARQLTPLSYDEIGRYLGGRDHTTVMHNFHRIDKGLPTDRALRSAIDDLLRRLGRAEMSSSCVAKPEATR